MIQDLILNMTLAEGDTKRIDCPHCYGKNTFTLSIRDGIALWNCYKASCNSRGAVPVTLSRNDLEKRIHKNLISRTKEKQLTYEQPTNFSTYFPEKMTKYMDKNNVTESWRLGHVDLYHDVVQDRCVFIIKKKQVLSVSPPVDAVGRALGRGTKWYRYSGTGEPFTVGYGDTLYLVEDAASACAISKYGTAMALLGTTLTNRALEIAKGYNRCVVCLDKDASKKALSLTMRLKQYTQTTMKLLQEDPKDHPEGVLG